MDSLMDYKCVDALGHYTIGYTANANIFVTESRVIATLKLSY